MSIKNTLMAVGITLAGFVKTGLAASNDSVVYNPSLARGKENFDSLQYSDKATWLIDLMYYITSLVAVAVIVYCAFRLLTGGWGDLEAEMKGRKGLWTALIAIVLLRVGLMLVGVVFGW
jgi:hypothetical protein